jgi:hypothetical protein
MAETPFDLGGLLDALQGQDLSQLLETASALFGQTQDDAPKQTQPPPDAMPDPALLMKLTRLFALLNHTEADPRADLLRALRPLVSEQRRERIDLAARMLQLTHILPQLRELDL